MKNVYKKPDKELKALFRAEYNKSLKKSEKSRSNKRFTKFEKEHRYYNKWEKGREIVLERIAKKDFTVDAFGTLKGEAFARHVANKTGNTLEYIKQNKSFIGQAKQIQIKETIKLMNAYREDKKNLQSLVNNPQKYQEYLKKKDKLYKELKKNLNKDAQKLSKIMLDSGRWEEYLKELENKLYEDYEHLTA